MTRSEAEKIISECLNKIRETCIELVPDFEDRDLVCSMYVSPSANAAFMMEDGDKDLFEKDYFVNINEWSEKFMREIGEEAAE